MRGNISGGGNAQKISATNRGTVVDGVDIVVDVVPVVVVVGVAAVVCIAIAICFAVAAAAAAAVPIGKNETLLRKKKPF